MLTAIIALFFFQFNVPSDFPSEDISIKLVEWIEISRALGAAKIFLYKLDVHSNILKVCLGLLKPKVIYEDNEN